MGEVLANTPQAFVNYTEALALPSDVDFFPDITVLISVFLQEKEKMSPKNRL